MKRPRNVNGNNTFIYKEISFITIPHVTTRRQSIAKPPMEDSYGRLHRNIDVREIKQVVNILHIHRRERERCMAWHMQACLVLRQFEYILNVTDYVNENYLRVKAKFLRAIDYVEDINVGKPTPKSSPSRHK